MLSLRKITLRKCLQSQANARWFIRSSLITLESTLILAQSLNFNFFPKDFQMIFVTPLLVQILIFFSIFITSYITGLGNGYTIYTEGRNFFWNWIRTHLLFVKKNENKIEPREKWHTKTLYSKVSIKCPVLFQGCHGQFLVSIKRPGLDIQEKVSIKRPVLSFFQILEA